MSDRYIVYMWGVGGKKLYMDGTYGSGVNLATAKELANDNASSMPNTYFFVREWDELGEIVYSVINRNGILEITDTVVEY